MATAPAGTGPRTIVVAGNGTQAASYTLPPGIFQYVQSVLVQVDATAAPAVRPTLSIAEQSGVVIATKRQGEAIPAGDTGSATWALRLTDDPGITRYWNAQFDGNGSGGFDHLRLVQLGPIPPGDIWPPTAQLTITGTWTFPAAAHIQVGVQHNGVGSYQAALQIINVQRLDVLQREVLRGFSIAAPQSPVTPLPINTHLFGANLIDFTVPTNCNIITAGTYALTFLVVFF
jgi:hypothetical protein